MVRNEMYKTDSHILHILKKLSRRLAADLRSSGGKDFIILLVVPTLAFVYQFLIRGDSQAHDRFDAAIVSLWSVLVVGLYKLVSSAVGLRGEQLRRWGETEPLIVGAPKPPSPRLAPLAAATLILSVPLFLLLGAAYLFPRDVVRNSVPAPPTFSILTSDGLRAPTRVGDSIMAADLERRRSQVLVIRNENDVGLTDMSVRFQFPEPIVGQAYIRTDDSVGDLTLVPCRMGLAVSGAAASATVGKTGRLRIDASGRGAAVATAAPEVCANDDEAGRQRPTGIYRLRVDKMLPRAELQIFFETAIDPKSPPFSVLFGEPLPEDLPFFGEGTVWFDDGATPKKIEVFVPIGYDSQLRQMSVLPGSKSDWKLQDVLIY